MRERAAYTTALRRETRGFWGCYRSATGNRRRAMPSVTSIV